MLNQSHVSGWRRADREASVFALNGLTATEVSPSDTEVRLVFRPPWLGTGSVIGGWGRPLWKRVVGA